MKSHRIYYSDSGKQWDIQGLLGQRAKQAWRSEIKVFHHIPLCWAAFKRPEIFAAFGMKQGLREQQYVKWHADENTGSNCTKLKEFKESKNTHTNFFFHCDLTDSVKYFSYFRLRFMLITGFNFASVWIICILTVKSTSNFLLFSCVYEAMHTTNVTFNVIRIAQWIEWWSE